MKQSDQYLRDHNMITAQDVDHIIATYNLPELLRDYEWDGQTLENAWARRCDLEFGLKTWSQTSWPPGAGFKAANAIHMWGFGNRSMPKQNWDWEHFYAAALGALMAGAEESACYVLIEKSKHIAIATASKYLCFADQSRFAIFDSRVGYALRELITHEQGQICRKIPCPPWRTTPHIQTGDAVETFVTAKAFAACNELCRQVARRLGQLPPDLAPTGITGPWLPTHVEMALFMAGADRDQSQLTIPLSKDLYTSQDAPRRTPVGNTHNTQAFAQAAHDFHTNHGRNQRQAIQSAAEKLGIDPKNLPEACTKHPGSYWHQWRGKGWID